MEFAYLKWILNNLNYIERLSIDLESPNFLKTDDIVWNSIVDADFVYQYCLPDDIITLKEFDFYIRCGCKSLKKTTDEIIYSFRIHPFFFNRQWTNIKCLYDPVSSYQHLSSSSIRQVEFYHDFM